MELITGSKVNFRQVSEAFDATCGPGEKLGSTRGTDAQTQRTPLHVDRAPGKDAQRKPKEN